MSKRSAPHHRPRPSGCIQRSAELERQRIDQLTVEQRIRLALGLKEHFAGLLQSPPVDARHEESSRPS